jgi:hypothetical protein
MHIFHYSEGCGLRKQQAKFSPAQKRFLEKIVQGEVLVRQESMAGETFFLN